MTRDKAALFKVAALLLATLAMVGCEVEFTPQVTPLAMQTPLGTPHAFGTIGPAGTLTPLEAEATADAELILTVIAFANQEPSPNSRGEPDVSSYEEVWCGDIDRVCYELCFRSECGIYDIENARVAQFVGAVDGYNDELLSVESGQRSQRKSGIAAFVSCAGTLLAGGGAYTLITAVDPEPVSKTVLAVGGAIVAGVACGGSLFSFADSGIERSIHEQEMQRQDLISEQAWQYLQEFGEEVEFDGTP